MGDEIDGLDLPLHEQSGNMDRGHASELNNNELAEQSTQLNNVLNQYYSGGANFNEVLDNLEDIGYTEERAHQIRATAQIERTIRVQNDGVSSGLAPNQLSFLQGTNHRAIFQTSGYHVYTDTDGRQYLHDNRVREDDGTPSRLYLPAPEQFNPLTIAQEEEQQQRIDSVRPDFLDDFILFDYPPYTGDRQRDDFTTSEKSSIDRLSQAYLENPTQQNLNDLRDGIDMFSDATYITNSNDILNQYMIDIQYEANYRSENNGRSPLLTEEQFNLLSTDPSRHYAGGLIYLDTTPRGAGTENYYYYDSFTGHTRSVPIIGTDGEVEDPVTIDDIRLPDSATRIAGYVEIQDPVNTRRYERRPLTSDEQNNIKIDMANAINGNITYKEFLERIDTNYTLSNAQFRDISDFVQANSHEPIAQEDIDFTNTYIDPPLRTDPVPPPGAVVTPPRVFEDVLGEDSNLLTTEEIERLSTQGLNAEQIRAAFHLLHPEVQIPNEGFYRRDTSEDLLNVEDLLREAATGTISPETIAPNIFQNTSGDPPLVPGTTLMSGGDTILPQASVARYEQYFNSRQNEFTPFRNMFRDILPVFTGAFGGYFAFSLARSRERGTIQEILAQERIFLDTLNVRLENFNDNLEQTGTEKTRLTDEFIFSEEELSKLEIETRTQQRTAQRAYARRGQGPEAVRAASAEFRRQREIGRELDTLRLQKKREAQALLQEVRTAEKNLDSLEQDIINENTNRRNILERVDRALAFDRQILQDINRYNPQILFGFSIGQTLGLALSGYLFPEYIDISDNDEFIKADNRNYNTDEKKEQNKTDKPKKPKLPFNVQKQNSIQTGPLENHSKINPLPARNFIPQKEQGVGRPLSYTEIMNYKSTLSTNELNNLKNKFLIFGADNNIIKKESTCKSIVGETIINKRKIR